MNMEAYWNAVRAFLEETLNSGKSWWETAADLYNSDNDSIIKNGFVKLFGLDGMIVTSVGDGAYNGTVENNKVCFQGYSYQRISERLTEDFGFIFKPLEGCDSNVMHAEAHSIGITITIGGGYLHRVWVSFNMSKIEKDKSKVFCYKEEKEEEPKKSNRNTVSWSDIFPRPRVYPPKYENEEDYWR